ncbi:MAG: DUF2059 domain-containing protein [Rhodomicrobium sp.]|jgi:hypothetical protein
MRAIAARCLALALLLPLSLPARALDDTPQNREIQADRYLEAIPPQGMIDELLARTADTLPADQQDPFKTLVSKHLDRAAITAAIRAAMAKTFTADELQALADFYGSTLGKAAMTKMQSYQQEVAPTLMNEFQSAVTKAEEEAHQASKAEEEKK